MYSRKPRVISRSAEWFLRYTAVIMKSQQKLKGAIFMTNKSMGSFLSELRKEKGITQRDLADYLAVSDKTISHWECDKYSPDLSAIPILAEYFGVTCDEILKGERKAPEYNENNFSFEPLDKKSEYEKYANIRLQNAYNKLKTSMVITVFVSVVTIAFLCNLMWFLDDIFYDWIYSGYSILVSHGIPASIIFGVSLFMLLSYLSYQKFKTVIISCNADESKISRWKRKGATVIAIPFIICLISLLLFICAIFPTNTINTDPTVALTDPPTSYSGDTSESFIYPSSVTVYPYTSTETSF